MGGKELFLPYDPYLQSDSEVFGVNEVLESSSPFLQIIDRNKLLKDLFYRDKCSATAAPSPHPKTD